MPTLDTADLSQIQAMIDGALGPLTQRASNLESAAATAANAANVAAATQVATEETIATEQAEANQQALARAAVIGAIYHPAFVSAPGWRPGAPYPTPGA
jgi:hypothetical protein